MVTTELDEISENLDLAKEIVDLISEDSVSETPMDEYSKLAMGENLYTLLVTTFSMADPSDRTQEVQFKCCKMAIQYLVPFAENSSIRCVKEGINDYIVKWYDLWRRAFAFSARRSLEHFIDFMELDLPKNKKVLGNRRDVLKPLVYYLNKSAFDDNLEYIEASFPPSYGKTYICNLYSAWLYGIDVDNTILRLSYNLELVLSASRTIQGFISDPKYSEVFPSFAKYCGKPFEKEKESDWIIKDSNNQTSHISRTRDGGTTGVRANKAIILDDMTKGVEEANNANLHRGIYDKWKTEWINRRTGDPITYVFVGTMWSPDDILNRIIEDQTKDHELIDDPKFKYTKVSIDGKLVVIRVPLLNERDESTCPSVMKTKDALKLRDSTNEFLFSCVYQQDPIAPEGLVFADETLQHYITLPRDDEGKDVCSNYSLATLDPARKGKDFVSMPICRTDGELYYMTDCLFKQEAMTELYDEIVDKIISQKIIRLVLENNTDTSLKALLMAKLKERHYLDCEIIEKYNTVVKEQRIKDLQGVVKNRIVFKDKTTYTSNTDYGRFMRNLTTYSFDFPNKHDDAPDAIAMFGKEIVLNGGKANKPKGVDRRLLGF